MWKSCLRILAIHSINKWCTMKLHLRNLCIREINTSYSESGCQGLERHRKLLLGDIHKGHAGNSVSSTSKPPINSCENTVAFMGTQQRSLSDWSAGLGGNWSFHIYYQHLCECVRLKQTDIFRQEDLEYICCSGNLFNFWANILNTRIEGGEYLTCNNEDLLLFFFSCSLIFFLVHWSDFYL